MKVRVITAAVAVTLPATACGSDSKKAQPAITQTTVAQPVTGGTLVVAISADPGSLNPAVTSDGGVHTASGPDPFRTVADPLLRPSHAHLRATDILNTKSTVASARRRRVRRPSSSAELPQE